MTQGERIEKVLADAIAGLGGAAYVIVVMPPEPGEVDMPHGEQYELTGRGASYREHGLMVGRAAGAVKLRHEAMYDMVAGLRGKEAAQAYLEGVELGMASMPAHEAGRGYMRGSVVDETA